MLVAPAIRLRVPDRGYFPFVRIPAVGAREESTASAPPPLEFCSRITQGPCCPRRLVWAAFGCLGLPYAGVGVAMALASWLVLPRLLLGCGGAGDGTSVPSGVGVV